MNNLHKYIARTVGLIVTLGLSTQAFSATATGTLTVTATVANTCIIGDATLAFGSYEPVVTHASANLDGSTKVSITCTKGASAKIYSTTAIADRKITNQTAGTDALSYTLYTDSGLSTALGIDDNAGTIDVTNATGQAQDIDLYGRIAGGQNVSAGNYSGTANLTISYTP